MNERSKQKGMVSLPAILIFTFVAGTLMIAYTARTLFLASQTHRVLTLKQANWLAEGAIERAISELSKADDPGQIDSNMYAIHIAPVYVDLDPLDFKDEPIDMSERAIPAVYGYTIKSAKELALQHTDQETMQDGFLITGQVEFSYRDTVLKISSTKLCVLKKDGSWTVFPIADTPST